MLSHLPEPLAARPLPVTLHLTSVLRGGGRRLRGSVQAQSPSEDSFNLGAASSSDGLADVAGGVAGQPQTVLQGTKRKRAQLGTKWAKRFPRKKRETTKKKKDVASQIAKVLDTRRLSKRQQELGAKEPASGSAFGSTLRHNARDAPVPSSEQGRASRLVAGRSVAVYVKLMQIQLLGPLPLDLTCQLRPQRGLSCKVRGRSAIIVDAFTRRGVALLDVGWLDKEGQGSWVVRDVETVRADLARDIGLHFQAVEIQGSIVQFQQVGDDNVRAAGRAPFILAAAANAVSGLRQALTAGSRLPKLELAVSQVTPAAAERHVQDCPGHSVGVRTDKGDIGYLLDVPVPLQVDLRPHRCMTCKASGISEVGNYFPVLPGDITAALPEARLLQTDRDGMLMATPVFLLHTIQLLYEECNVRAVRRRLADLYSANALADALRESNPAAQSGSLVFSLQAIPHAGPLKKLILHFFHNFVQARVQIATDLQLIFNGQGLRGDGNYNISTRVAEYTDGRWVRGKWTEVLAWCGLDGSLLKPMALAASEKMTDIIADLQPMLERMQKVRMHAGLTLEQTVPVFHATDSYGKHRIQLMTFYKDVFKEVRLEATFATPRSNADGVAVRSDAESPVPHLLKITGDPQHDVYKVRMWAKPAANNYSDFCFDHLDMMMRLSAAPSTWTSVREVPSSVLNDAGRKLLVKAVTRSAAVFKSAVANDPDGGKELRLFLVQPFVTEHRVWKNVWGSQPPRGTVARIARRLQVELHVSCRQWAYDGKHRFVEEIGRMEAWYTPGKKKDRWHRGIVRDGKPKRRATGQKSVFSPSVTLHYARLNKPLRLEGMWAWAEIAQSLHLAGLPVHSGTVAVERLWSLMKSYLPPQGRRMTEVWFSFLSDLCFLKATLLHYHANAMPSWTDGDALLLQRAEGMLHIARAWQGDPEYAAFLEEIKFRPAPAATKDVEAEPLVAVH
jgi:hypothetical protein